MSCTYIYQQVVSILIEAITACLITLKQPMMHIAWSDLQSDDDTSGNMF